MSWSSNIFSKWLGLHHGIQWLRTLVPRPPIPYRSVLPFSKHVLHALISQGFHVIQTKGYGCLPPTAVFYQLCHKIFILFKPIYKINCIYEIVGRFSLSIEFSSLNSWATWSIRTWILYRDLAKEVIICQSYRPVIKWDANRSWHITRRSFQINVSGSWIVL